MTRKSDPVPAVRTAASLAAKAVERLEAAAAEIHAAETARRDGMQIVFVGGKLSGLIRQGATTVQIDGENFAVSISQ